MNTNHTPEDPLDAAEAALRDLPPTAQPTAATLDRIARLAYETEAQTPSAQPPVPARHTRRTVVAWLMTAATLLAMVYGLMHSPQSTLAFEDVVAAVRKSDTVSYITVVTQQDGPTVQSTMYHKGALTRMEQSDGTYMVTDRAGQKMLMVQPAQKTALLTRLGTKPPQGPVMRDSILSWLKTAETSGKPVGEKTIDGVLTQGFEAPFGAITLTIWVDPQTKLPVQIESAIGSTAEPMQMVMRNFDFNAPLDDALFSLTPPAGYQVKEQQQPEIDVAALLKLPPEEHVVRILKFYAGLNDGAFPERIDGPELVTKLTTSAGPEKLKDPKFKQEFANLTASMGAAWTFRQSLDKFGYLGMAHLNDQDSIVFWYLPKDAEKYRVVYANLTIGDVTADKLPKVPAK